MKTSKTIKLNLLIIGLTFPEPATTAAGSRLIQILELFIEEGYQITFASTAAVSDKSMDLESLGISIQNILLNDSGFDEFVKQLNPDIVFFDRYITEEQFGWRVSENCPNALKLMDTQDLHCLRKAREEAVKQNIPVVDADLFTTIAKREIASIYRCDLTLIISEKEMEILMDIFKIPSELIYYLPFLVESTSEEKKKALPKYSERKNFIAIGTFLHPPNVDAVMQLKKIWPEIKKQLPQSELHIYGAYAPQKILQLDNKKDGFFINGWAESVEEVMKNSKVQLAFLRFGAGQKGKLLDAMTYGTPTITTSIGAEGMNGSLGFNGEISDDEDSFVKNAVSIFSDEEKWNVAHQNGFKILEKRFQKSLFSEDFKKHILNLFQNLKEHRQQNFMGQILQHHTMQSTRYLSKWIEAKNSPNSTNVCFEKSNEVRDEYKYE